jgi:hypothetical protein
MVKCTQKLCITFKGHFICIHLRADISITGLTKIALRASINSVSNKNKNHSYK